MSNEQQPKQNQRIQTKQQAKLPLWPLPERRPNQVKSFPSELVIAQTLHLFFDFWMLGVTIVVVTFDYMHLIYYVVTWCYVCKCFNRVLFICFSICVSLCFSLAIKLGFFAMCISVFFLVARVSSSCDIWYATVVL